MRRGAATAPRIGAWPPGCWRRRWRWSLDLLALAHRVPGAASAPRLATAQPGAPAGCGSPGRPGRWRLWTLWRWRRQLTSRHVALPLWFVLVPLVATLVTPTPPTARCCWPCRRWRRSPPSRCRPSAAASSALIDWFTLLFFSGCAIIIWVIWIAMQTGLPAKPAANVARLAPGFVPQLLAAGLRRSRWPPPSPGPGWCAGAPAATAPRSGRPGAAGRRRGAVLAAGDDAVAAGAGLRAQLRAAGATRSSSTIDAPGLRRRARPDRGQHRGAALPRRSSTCSRCRRRSASAPGCWSAPSPSRGCTIIDRHATSGAGRARCAGPPANERRPAALPADRALSP